MPTRPKIKKEVPREPIAAKPPMPPEPASPEMFADMLHKGVLQIAQAQKSMLDTMSQYGRDGMKVWKQTMRVPDSMPGIYIFDLAEQTMQKIIEVQKTMLDVVVQQSSRTVDAAKESTKYFHAVNEMVQQTSKRAMEGQKEALESAAEQTRMATRTMKTNLGAEAKNPVTAAAESMQRGVDIAIETQKELLEVAAKPLSVSASR